MKTYKLGIITYTVNEDGSITRTVDETAQAQIIAATQDNAK